MLIAILDVPAMEEAVSCTSRRNERNRIMSVNMKMVQQMQARLEKVQRELAETVVEGTAGGGVVKARVTAAREFRGIQIDPAAVDPEDVEVLEDLITAAIQDAMERATTVAEEKMGALTGGMKIPGLM
jgi:DNA-binding YbaB/EbfC family protein